MPEIKHNFTTGKMNKDLDERLVRNGEYRHAENIQIHTTDQDGGSGAAGVVQNLKGTALIGESFIQGWMNETAPVTESEYFSYGNSQQPRCVASIADEKNDKAYFFFASPMTRPSIVTNSLSSNSDGQKYIDIILEQDQNNNTVPVVIDFFGYVNSLANILLTTDDVGSQFSSWSTIQVGGNMINNFRVGMKINFIDNFGNNILPNSCTIKAIDGQLLLFEEMQSINPISVANEGGYSVSDILIVAEAPRVLKFSSVESLSVNMTPPTPSFITGINIIDNLILWTDAYSEPKKINIDRCKAGTDTTTYLTSPKHTKLFVKNKDGDLVDAASINHNLDQSEINNFSGLQMYGGGVNSDLQEQHITVMRKAPSFPPSLLMNEDSRALSGSEVTITHTFVDNINSTQISVGDVIEIEAAGFATTNYRANDLINVTLADNSLTDPTIFTVKFITYLTAAPFNTPTLQSTNKIKIEVVTTTGINVDDTQWKFSIKRPDPIFELKLVRFGYRYKYEDGEYSAFSPWSEIAFMPKPFELTPATAYNLGMENDCRTLVIKDFVPASIPLDVKEVDILYKTTDNANVYVVDTVKRDISSEWELYTPDGDVDTVDIKTGYLEITSEMIHKVLPANQTLRAWDNVPRYALAQEITGNRLLYGNYTQGYDLNEPVGLVQRVKSLSDIDEGAPPKKSIKSLRRYKIGMVFGDKYGRETPVITPKYTTIDNSEEGFSSLTADISIPKTLCANSNSFVVSQTWGDPNTNVAPPITSSGGWIDYVKYYVKETSNEYYNLVMDRWYPSGDHGTLWLSFNSADRNKVDEETYLILKNQHGSNQPVLEKARYKIIAIENEAPKFIKTKISDLGRLKDFGPEETYDSVWTVSSVDQYSVQPFNLWASEDPSDNNKIKINKDYWMNSTVGGSNQDGTDTEAFGRMMKGGAIKVRIVGRNKFSPQINLKSQWRIVTHWTFGEGIDTVADDDADTSPQIVALTLNSPFVQNDVDMLTKFQDRYAGGMAPEWNPAVVGGVSGLQYDMEFAEEIVQNKPEFEGKFFVKINKDISAINYLAQVTGDSDWGHAGNYKLHYISASYKNKHVMTTPPSGDAAITYEADFDGSTTDGTAWFGGAFADFVTGGGDDNLFDNASFYLENDDGDAMADPTGSYGTDEANADFSYNMWTAGTESSDWWDVLNPANWFDSDVDMWADSGDTWWRAYGLPNLMTFQNSDGEWIAASSISSYGQQASGSLTSNVYPVPFTSQNTETSFSPFGSCSENYNDMTRKFWQDVYPTYDSALQTTSEGIVDSNTWTSDFPSNSTGVVFLDEVNMAKMVIRNGPQAGSEIDPNSGDIHTGPYGISEGGPPPYDGDERFDKYWRPVNAFHTGEAMINGLLPEQGGESFGVGSMCISWSGAGNQGRAPALWTELRKPGTYFSFDNDTSGPNGGPKKYRTVGVIRSSKSSDRQYNFRGYNNKATSEVNIPPIFDYGSYNDGILNQDILGANDLEGDAIQAANADGIVNGVEANNCDIYYSSSNAVSHHIRRHTQWVEFREVDEQNPANLFNKGMDLSEYDPRAFMHHDGRDYVGITLYKYYTELETTELGEETEIEQGACFETEPKEDVGLDIYYEASPAIPMTLTKENAFNFAPINSKIKVKRKVQDVEAYVGLPESGLKVSNIHFSGEKSSQAIITVQSLHSSGEWRLHKKDIMIDDILEFVHSDGMITSAVVKSFFLPKDFPYLNNGLDSNENQIGDNGFYTISSDDEEYGLVSGPKAFEQSSGNLEQVIAFYNSETNQVTTVLNSDLSAGMQVQGITVDVNGVSQSYNATTEAGPVYINSVSEITSTASAVTFSNGTYPINNAVIPAIVGQQNVSENTTILLNVNAPTGYYGIDIEVWDRPVELGWFNCYSFGNGVESDRIRDDFNAPQIDNGVKVSTTLSDYGEQNITSGLIYSGIYNSTSQVNDLNEFNQGEKITKELNPSYGAIQALKTRDTDVVVFTEDKVLKVLSNKDALYNADGNPQLTATERVLGQTVPFTGDYGISNNPESLAVDQFRMYFTDRQRGAVLRLSQDGLTPISQVGMGSWFRHRLKYTTDLIGTWDDITKEYNLTMIYHNSSSYTNNTISFNENTKGWTSFKTFVLSQGFSVAGRYLSTKKSKIYQHHADVDLSGNPVNRNTFHDDAYYPSKIEVLLNDMPSSVKSFQTINYEGSRARSSKRTPNSMSLAQEAYNGQISFDADGNPLESLTTAVPLSSGKDRVYNYDTLFDINGWYVENMRTDLQGATVRDFKNKEGKWFGQVKGLGGVDDSQVIDTSQFRVQGIGMADKVQYTGVEVVDGGGNTETGGCEDGLTLVPSGDCVEFIIFGCTDVNASNFDASIGANVDDGTCLYNVVGCMDYLDPSYDSSANISDSSMCTGYTNGCMDDGFQPWSPFTGNAALNYDPTATQAGYTIITSGAAYGLEDSYTFIQIVWPGGVFSQDPPYNSGNSSCPSNYVGCCNYGTGGGDFEIDIEDEWEELITDESLCTDAGGVWVNDPDAGIVEECFGCTTYGNENYNPYATIDCSDAIGYPNSGYGQCDDDGGTCICCKDETTETGVGCTDMTACNFDEDAILGCANNTCCNYDCYCCSDETATNFNNLAGTFTSLEYPHADCVFFSTDQPFPCVDGWGPGTQQYGCTDPSAANYLGDEAIANGALPCPDGTCDDLVDNSWCECCAYGGDPGDNTEIVDPESEVGTDEDTCINEFGDIDPACGCTDETMFNYCASCTISCTYCCIPFVYGCTDSTALNYNSEANTDDGSCVPYIYGCTDETASNYCSECNTYEGPCIYPVYGCTDATAWNYNIEATEDDGSCEPIICGCMDPEAENFNPLANTIYAYLNETQVFALENGNAPLEGVDTSMCVAAFCEYTAEFDKVNLNVKNLDNDESDEWPQVDNDDNPWPIP